MHHSVLSPLSLPADRSVQACVFGEGCSRGSCLSGMPSPPASGALWLYHAPAGWCGAPPGLAPRLHTLTSQGERADVAV